MTEEQSLKVGQQELEEKADYNMRYFKHLFTLSKEKPSEFWGSLAQDLLDWYEPWKETMRQENPMTKWFLEGKINASYNAVDIHLNTSRKFKAAVVWESELGERKIVTYQDMFYEVNRWANALLEL